jgi:hypothetical protein
MSRCSVLPRETGKRTVRTLQKNRAPTSWSNAYFATEHVLAHYIIDKTATTILSKRL